MAQNHRLEGDNGAANGARIGAVGMVTPSGWYDDARKNNESGHDEMQMAVYDWLLSQEVKNLRYGDTERRLERRSVTFEFPMYRPRYRGRAAERIIAFADLAELFAFPGETDFRAAILFEIKPKIETIGGIIRQCHGYQVAFQAAYPERTCNIVPVVPADDPKIEELRKVRDCLGWDARTKEMQGDRFG